jgi:hypothetical protein
VSKHLHDPELFENPEMGVFPDGQGQSTLGQKPASLAPAHVGFVPPF